LGHLDGRWRNQRFRAVETQELAQGFALTDQGNVQSASFDAFLVEQFADGVKFALGFVNLAGGGAGG